MSVVVSLLTYLVGNFTSRPQLQQSPRGMVDRGSGAHQLVLGNDSGILGIDPAVGVLHAFRGGGDQCDGGGDAARHGHKFRLLLALELWSGQTLQDNRHDT